MDRVHDAWDEPNFYCTYRDSKLPTLWAPALPSPYEVQEMSSGISNRLEQ